MDEQIKGLQAAVGSMAEMSHMFYSAMIGCGASEEEALACAKTFLATTQSEIIKSLLGKSND